MEHRRKYERKKEEKLIREKQERIKKAREEHARAQRVRHESACKYIGQGKCLHVPHNLGGGRKCSASCSSRSFVLPLFFNLHVKRHDWFIRWTYSHFCFLEGKTYAKKITLSICGQDEEARQSAGASFPGRRGRQAHSLQICVYLQLHSGLLSANFEPCR